MEANFDIDVGDIGVVSILEMKLGCTMSIKHKIDTRSSQFIELPLRSVPYHQHEIIQIELGKIVARASKMRRRARLQKGW